MESGVIPDSHITSSSIFEWPNRTGQVNVWKPENARLKRIGPPWAAFISDEHQWLQIDLNKEKKVTGTYLLSDVTSQQHSKFLVTDILFSSVGP